MFNQNQKVTVCLELISHSCKILKLFSIMYLFNDFLYKINASLQIIFFSKQVIFQSRDNIDNIDLARNLVGQFCSAWIIFIEKCLVLFYFVLYSLFFSKKKSGKKSGWTVLFCMDYLY